MVFALVQQRGLLRLQDDGQVRGVGDVKKGRRVLDEEQRSGDHHLWSDVCARTREHRGDQCLKEGYQRESLLGAVTAR